MAGIIVVNLINFSHIISGMKPLKYVWTTLVIIYIAVVDGNIWKLALRYRNIA